MRMVCATVNPSFLAASCCRVDVVNGGAGVLRNGLREIASTVNVAPFMLAMKSAASFSFLKRWSSSAFISCVLPLSSLMNMAVTLNDGSLRNAAISLSLSTMSLTATDCTLPADSAGFTFFQSTGESSNPTIRSSMRRACCALTRLMSMFRGFSTACFMASLVISWKTILFVCSGFSPNTSYRCHEMASPSRSSSDASHTVSALSASFFSSATSFFFSAGISYSGVKSCCTSMLNFFFFRSLMCP